MSIAQTQVWFKYPEFNWKDKQITIIGGGIAGAQAAWHLCQKGWQVTLIEQHKTLAKEASGNPAGVILPKMTAQASVGEDFYVKSFEYTINLLNTIAAQGHHLEWDNCGALQLAYNPREKKRWQSLKNRKLPHHLVQTLDEKDTQTIAGIMLHPDQAYRSLYFPKAAWINPSSFAAALTNHPNCHTIYHKKALRLRYLERCWQVLDGTDRIISQSEVLILANGKSLCDFEQTRFLPHLPVAGQTTTASASNLSAELNTVIGHEGYLTPAINDQHIFGATFKRNIKQAEKNSQDDKHNLDQLCRYLPLLGESLTGIKTAHAAVRMTTPDRFPYVGAVPDKDFYLKNYSDLHQGKQWKNYPDARYHHGLFVLGGLGSRGLTTSGYCANALASLLENKLDQNSIIALSNCHPARFLIRNLKRNII